MADDQPKPDPKDEAERSGPDARRKKQMVGAGVAVGIGSAALVAALLYARGTRRTGE